jgi:hypothetical protein
MYLRENVLQTNVSEQMSSGQMLSGQKPSGQLYLRTYVSSVVNCINRLLKTEKLSEKIIEEHNRFIDHGEYISYLQADGFKEELILLGTKRGKFLELPWTLQDMWQ